MADSSPFHRLPPIICGICNKRVDAMTMEYSDLRMATIITVRCHGDSDEMEMTSDFLHAIGRDGVNEIMRKGGVAFQKSGAPALPEVTHG